jgi:demethylmenaquinone methyltransferase/2-methoxy-6-polyprenyl-1,4-benzoquinol methylase
LSGLFSHRVHRGGARSAEEFSMSTTADPGLRDYYARRAAEYERIYAKPERQSDLARLRADLAAAFRGCSVLELACGTGYWTPHLALHASRVDAYDINDETLAIARTKPVDRERVHFACGDAYAPPVRAPRHDAAFAGFWWSHMLKRDIPRFLDGLHAALAPGARVVFIDNRMVEGSSTPIARTDDCGNTYQSRLLDDGSRHEVLKNFPDAAELIAAVKPQAASSKVRLLDYYWWLEYTLR